MPWCKIGWRPIPFRARYTSSPIAGETGLSYYFSTGRGSGSVPRDLSHTARFTHFAKLLYPYHPLFHAGSADLESLGVRSDMLVTRLPDGTRRGIPAWMFDEGICAAVRNSPYPIMEVAALLEIVKLLELNRLEIRSERDERPSQSQEVCDVKVAADTSNTSTRKPRNRPTDSGREKVRVHRVDSRVDRSGHRSFPNPGRRIQ